MEACALALQSEDLSKKQRRRKRSDLNNTGEHCLAGPGQRALREEEEGRSVFFFLQL